MTFTGLKHMIYAQAIKVIVVSNPPVPPFSKGGRRSKNILPLFSKGGKGGLNRGFTLVEVIVTIIAVSIVSVIFMNFMGKAMSHSTRAVEIVQGEASAEATLERIIADYVFKINQDSSTALGLLKTDIDSPTLKYGVNVSAGYIVFDAAACVPPAVNVQCSKADTSGAPRTLKVTVAASGNDLTILLTRSRNANSPPAAF
jgi:prepilin-type N-terminal cleavage/methylation domain-containing protein